MSGIIKFRAWDKESKKIRKINSIAFDGSGNIKLVNMWGYDLIERKDIIVQRETNVELVRFTGLSDKNGKEIYEGDFINLINADGKSINVVCKFGTVRREIFENTVDITGFYFELSNGRKTFPIVNNYLGKHDLEIFEVIGNIYENLELMEVDK